MCMIKLIVGVVLLVFLIFSAIYLYKAHVQTRRMRDRVAIIDEKEEILDDIAVANRVQILDERIEEETAVLNQRRKPRRRSTKPKKEDV